jgi:hypothetical protein
MNDLGVDINLDKSLTSERGLAEFAKRLIGHQGDISPISPKLILQTALRPQGLVEVIRDMTSRGVQVQAGDLKRFIDKVPGSKRLTQDFI